jgi:hypothetical protein
LRNSGRCSAAFHFIAFRALETSRKDYGVERPITLRRIDQAARAASGAPAPRDRTQRQAGLKSAKRHGRGVRSHHCSASKKTAPGPTLRQTWQAVRQVRIYREPRKREATRFPRCGRPYTRDCAGLVGDHPCRQRWASNVT